MTGMEVASPLDQLAAGANGDLVDAAVARLRTAARPVSLAGLYNTAWLGYQPRRGYEGPASHALIDEVRRVAHGHPMGHDRLGPQPAVPVGAIVSLDLGFDEVYGEVVWKEGAHPALDAGWVPGWLAGAPSLPHDGTAPQPTYAPPSGGRVLSERLVVDFGCFGDDLAPSAVQQARLRRRGIRVDRYGHLLVDALYDDGVDEADDLAFWAAWTARNHPGALAAAGLPAEASALVKTASNLTDALSTHPEVRGVGGYYLHADVYAALVAADGPGGSLHHVVRGLVHLPARTHTAWACMSARIADTLAEDEVAGLAWPTMVVTASLLALDTLAEEAPDGAWNGAHVRLDDVWQGGGLWRTELLGDSPPIAVDPAVALGLGWAEHTGTHLSQVAGLGPEDQVQSPEWYDSTGWDAWEITGSEVAWRVHLTAHDIDTDRLRLPPTVSELVQATLIAADQDRLLIALQHDAEQERREFCGVGDDGHLDLEWPLGILPGTTVQVSWALNSTVIDVTTRRLAVPEQIGELTYTHEYNLRIALTAAGMGDTPNPPVTLRQLVRAAVRHYGTLTENGNRCLGLDAIVARCFGPHGEIVPGYDEAVLRRAIGATAASLAAAGDGRLDGDLFTVDGRTATADRQVDAELLARYVEETRRRLRRDVTRHWVEPAVVNLPPTWRRSKEKSDGWVGVAGTGRLPAGDLAPNQTWRKGHPRGATVPAEVTAALERAKRSLAHLPVVPEALVAFDDVATDPFTDDEPPIQGTASRSGRQEESPNA